MGQRREIFITPLTTSLLLARGRGEPQDFAALLYNKHLLLYDLMRASMDDRGSDVPCFFSPSTPARLFSVAKTKRMVERGTGGSAQPKTWQKWGVLCMIMSLRLYPP